MPEGVMLLVDGAEILAQEGQTLSSALFAAGFDGRIGRLWCGSGHCHACAVTVDGTQGVRACMVLVRPGMRVERDGRGQADA